MGLKQILICEEGNMRKVPTASLREHTGDQVPYGGASRRPQKGEGRRAGTPGQARRSGPEALWPGGSSRSRAGQAEGRATRSSPPPP